MIFYKTREYNPTLKIFIGLNAFSSQRTHQTVINLNGIVAYQRNESAQKTNIGFIFQKMKENSVCNNKYDKSIL